MISCSIAGEAALVAVLVRGECEAIEVASCRHACLASAERAAATCWWKIPRCVLLSWYGQVLGKAPVPDGATVDVAADGVLLRDREPVARSRSRSASPSRPLLRCDANAGASACPDLSGWCGGVIDAVMLWPEPCAWESGPMVSAR